jgi:hypothetical protein
MKKNLGDEKVEVGAERFGTNFILITTTRQQQLYAG